MAKQPPAPPSAPAREPDGPAAPDAARAASPKPALVVGAHWTVRVAGGERGARVHALAKDGRPAIAKLDNSMTLVEVADADFVSPLP